MKAECNDDLGFSGLSLSSAEGPGATTEEVPGGAPYLLVDDASLCREHVGRLLDSQQDVALDLEGVNLSRDGRLCLIQLAESDPDAPVLLIDIVTLGEEAFGHGRLRELLESSNVAKLVYDPRSDCDALYHLHGTTLSNVVDVQVLQSLENDSPHDRFVKGLAKALERYSGLTDAERKEADRIKQEGIGLFVPEKGGTYEVWVDRPLSRELLEYAALDVRHLHGMAKVWGAEPGSERRKRAIEAADSRMEKERTAVTVIKGREKAFKDF